MYIAFGSQILKFMTPPSYCIITETAFDNWLLPILPSLLKSSFYYYCYKRPTLSFGQVFARGLNTLTSQYISLNYVPHKPMCSMYNLACSSVVVDYSWKDSPFNAWRWTYFLSNLSGVSFCVWSACSTGDTMGSIGDRQVFIACILGRHPLGLYSMSQSHSFSDLWFRENETIALQRKDFQPARRVPLNGSI